MLRSTSASCFVWDYHTADWGILAPQPRIHVLKSGKRKKLLNVISKNNGVRTAVGAESPRTKGCEYLADKESTADWQREWVLVTCIYGLAAIHVDLINHSSLLTAPHCPLRGSTSCRLRLRHDSTVVSEYTIVHESCDFHYISFVERIENETSSHST
ncbi:hypothetical protein J6590_032367 [Homalodisca vitripennis]|nr:hypothetical protein J6590_032367 [Homalodisca vitripennis]